MSQKLPGNHFKQSLARSHFQTGLWSSMCSTVACEIVADCGFDWMMFDLEHAPLEIGDLLPLLQALGRVPTHPVVRPPWNDAVAIKRLLDLGVQTLLVPFVQSAEEAASAVAATRYPPVGNRGVAGLTRATRFGRIANYAAQAADEVCLLVQVETGAALEQLEAIAMVDGVDGVFIGPSDLAASLGHVGNPGHTDVQVRLREAAQRLKAIGKPAGILATKVDDAKRYREWGYGFVAVGVDVGLLAAAADRALEAMREA